MAGPDAEYLDALSEDSRDLFRIVMNIGSGVDKMSSMNDAMSHSAINDFGNDNMAIPLAQQG